MADNTNLTLQIAEQYIEGNGSSDLNSFTSIDDAAAEFLGRFSSGVLSLDGITRLTEPSAKALSNIDTLYFRGLQQLSNGAARGLAQQEGYRASINLNRLAQIDDETAILLAAHRGAGLNLGITELTPRAAESFGQYKGQDLYLGSLSIVNAECAELLACFEGDLFLNGGPVWHSGPNGTGLRSISIETAHSFRKKQLGRIALNTELLNELNSETIIALDGCTSFDSPKSFKSIVANSFAASCVLPEKLKSLKKLLRPVARLPYEGRWNSDQAKRRSSRFRSVCAEIKQAGCSSGDLSYLFSERSLNDLLNTMNPFIWEGLASILSTNPNLFARLLRVAVQVVGYKQSRYSSDGRFEDCVDGIITTDSSELSQLLAFVLHRTKYRLHSIQMGTKQLTDEMAKSLSKCTGNLDLKLDNLSDSAAKILRDAGHG